MAKKIQIDIEVNGKMQKATVSAKKLRDALAGVDQQQEKVSKSARETDRNIKGTANASSNAAKNFSKMSQGMGGLVGAYASLAASLFAVSAAFQFLKSAGELKSLQSGQEAFAAATGTAMRSLTNDIIAATEAQVQFRDAAQGAAIGTAAGINAEQLQRLATAAKDASQVLGRDVTDSFNRLIRGATKAEPELLDELGIILRLETASKNYKNALNITGRELTAFERTQAVTNEILTQSEEKYSRILDIVGRSPNQYSQLGKAFDDIIMKVKEVVDQVVGPFAKVLQETPALGVAALGLLVSGPLSALGLSFGDIASSANEAAEKQRTFYQGVKDEVKQAQKTTKDFKKDLQGLARVGIADGAKAGFLDKLASGKVLQGADVARFTSAVKAAENHVNSSGVIVKGAFTGMKIHMVKEMEEAYLKMNAAQANTLTKTQMFGLKTRAVFAGIAASAQAIGASLASTGAKLINLIGYIGMAYTLFQVLKGVFGEKTELTEAQIEENRLKEFSERLGVLNQEFAKFVDIQKELNQPGTNLFYRNIGTFLSAQTSQDLKDMTSEYQRLGNTVRRENRNMLEKTGIGAALIGGALSGGAAGAMSFTPFGIASGAIVGGLGAAYATYTAQGKGMLGSEPLDENAEMNAARKRIEDRFGAIKEAIAAAVEDTNIVYRPFEMLNSAIDDFYNNPKDADIEKALRQAYRAAQDFGLELTANAKRATMISEQIQQATQKYAPVSAEEQAADTIDQQLEALRREREELFGQAPERRKKIRQEETKLLAQRKLLRDIDEAGFEIEKRRLDLQIKKNRAVEGETAAQARLRNLLNQKLQIESRIEDIATKTRQTEASAKVRMQELGFTGTLEDFLRTSEGIEFNRGKILLNLELQVAQMDLADVQTRYQNALLGPRLDNEKEISRLKLQAYNMDKEMLGFKQAEVDLIRTQIEAQKQADEFRIEAAMRTERLTNPFYYLTEEKKRAQLELDAAEASKDKRIEAIEQEKALKLEMITLEGQMLRERRAIALLELRAAQSKLDKDSETYRRIGTELNQMEGRTPEFEERLRRSEDARRKSVETKSEAERQAVEEEIAAKRYVLELTNELRIANEEASQSLEANMTNAFASVIDGSSSAKEAFRSLADSMIQDVSRIIAKLLVQQAIMASMRMLSGLFGGPAAGVTASVGPTLAGGGGHDSIMDMIDSMGSGRYGGVLKGYSAGGIARGSDAGHLAMLHGTEAVVPLPNGRSIPVEMQGGQAQQNNVSVNVSINNDGSSDVTSEGDAKGMGKAIAAAVQRELLQQKRPGGMLSPYGGTR